MHQAGNRVVGGEPAQVGKAEDRLGADDDRQIADELLDVLTRGAIVVDPRDASVPDELVSEISQEQQDAVTTAVRAWVGDVDEEAAEALVARYTLEYDETYVGWSGGTALDDVNTYIRIDGPGLWIEFSNQDAIAVGAPPPHDLPDQTADYGGSFALRGSTPYASPYGGPHASPYAWLLSWLRS